MSVDIPIESDFKRGDGGFLIQLAAYLFGTRVQFEEWLLDGRIPIEYSTHPVHFGPRVASAFFTLAYDTWRGWDPGRRRMFTTVLYMHSKAPAYEWLWEAFLLEYVVFDALWKLNSLREAGHAARLRQLCTLYGMPYESDAAREIVALRNQLIHEAIWEGDAPGFRITQHGWDCTQRLRTLNQRVIAATLGWRGNYVTNTWIHANSYIFFE